ncbi:hypothetical protein MTP04_36420 [Lysinibacillus sp. PLM2]|nr:hypothetical protein MTP04_36420 [Lysinibacillus sp. PLM2]
MLRVLLELIRIFLIIFLGCMFLGAIMRLIYTSFGINVDNTIGGWFVGPAILLILFVLYRNWLQFSGFIKGDIKSKLSKKMTISLCTFAFILLVTAPLFT